MFIAGFAGGVSKILFVYSKYGTSISLVSCWYVTAIVAVLGVVVVSGVPYVYYNPYTNTHAYIVYVYCYPYLTCVSINL